MPAMAFEIPNQASRDAKLSGGQIINPEHL